MGIIINGNTLSGNNFNPLGEQPSLPSITRGLVCWLDAGDNSSYANTSYYYDCGYGCQYYTSNPGCTNCNTQWKDISGNGYDGTLNNGITNEYNNNGGAMVFNGSNQNVTIPPASIPTGTQISFCVWNYGITRVPSSVIEARDSSGNRTINVHLTWVDSNVYFDCGGDRLYQNAPDANYLGWHYWGFTKNSSTGSMKIYLDGVLWASSTSNSGTINTTTAVRIGSYAVDTTFHNGKVGIVQLYNREITSNEISQNYNSQRQRFGV